MTSLAGNRRYPRAAVNEPAVLTVRAREQSRRVPVAIKTISPEGAGLSLRDQGQRVEHRATVRMGFSIDGRPFEIPGLIVWVASPAAPQGSLDVGVRFLLAAVPHETRQAYARWVVELLRQRGVSQEPPRRPAP